MNCLEQHLFLIPTRHNLLLVLYLRSISGIYFIHSDRKYCHLLKYFRSASRSLIIHSDIKESCVECYVYLFFPPLSCLSSSSSVVQCLMFMHNGTKFIGLLTYARDPNVIIIVTAKTGRRLRVSHLPGAPSMLYCLRETAAVGEVDGRIYCGWNDLQCDTVWCLSVKSEMPNIP